MHRILICVTVVVRGGQWFLIVVLFNEGDDFTDGDIELGVDGRGILRGSQGCRIVSDT